METVRASFTWTGPDHDALRLWREPPSHVPISSDVLDGDIALFREIDADDEPTGPIAGVEIVGFLTFDRWRHLPKTRLLWQLPGWPPLTLGALLKRLQRELRAESGSPWQRAPRQREAAAV